MEPEVSLLCLQNPVTEVSPEPIIPVHIITTYFSKTHFGIILPHRADSQVVSWDFPTKILYAI
jgi:hypothetical protein